MATVATLQNRVSRVSTEFASLDAAVTALGANDAVLTLAPGDTKTLTGNLTIPANVTLDGRMGVIATGAFTLTIQGECPEVNYQVFDVSGGGSVVGLKAANPRMFGAVADGATDCHAAFQACVDSGASEIHLSPGRYYSSAPVELPHTESYHRRDTGITISGHGIKTVLTRNDVAPASDAEAVRETQGFFNNYGSNNTIRDFLFEDCAIAIYNGQDPAELVELSHTSFNTFRELFIYNCGTAILSACALGHYYNRYENIHIAQCQIGIDFIEHSRWTALSPGVDNNNRNTLLNLRITRCIVGIWYRNGGTNGAVRTHCEGCGAAPTNNRYGAPSGLPGGITTAAYIVEGNNNSITDSYNESCDFYLYNAGHSSTFEGLFRIDEQPGSSIFVVEPRFFFSRTEVSLAGGTIAHIANTHPTLFPDVEAGRVTFKGVRHPDFLTGGQRLRKPASPNSEVVTEIIPLGAIAASASADFVLWPDLGSPSDSASAVFEVTVLGNSQDSAMAHVTSFKVAALRIASGTPTRYYVYDEVVGRATGPNVGSATEPLVPSLSLDGIDLICTITAPAREFANVTAIVRKVQAK